VPRHGGWGGAQNEVRGSRTSTPRAARRIGVARQLLHLHGGGKGNNTRLHEPSSPVRRTLVDRASPVSKNPRGVAVVSFSRWLQRHLHESRRRDHPLRCPRNHRECIPRRSSALSSVASSSPAARSATSSTTSSYGPLEPRRCSGPVVASPPSSPSGPRPVSVAPPGHRYDGARRASGSGAVGADCLPCSTFERHS
jgi:hypothetical protein